MECRCIASRREHSFDLHPSIWVSNAFFAPSLRRGNCATSSAAEIPPVTATTNIPASTRCSKQTVSPSPAAMTTRNLQCGLCHLVRRSDDRKITSKPSEPRFEISRLSLALAKTVSVKHEVQLGHPSATCRSSRLMSLANKCSTRYFFRRFANPCRFSCLASMHKRIRHAREMRYKDYEHDLAFQHDIQLLITTPRINRSSQLRITILLS